MTKNKNATNDNTKLGWRERLAAKNVAKDPEVEYSSLQDEPTPIEQKGTPVDEPEYKPEPYPTTPKKSRSELRSASGKKVKIKKDKKDNPVAKRPQGVYASGKKNINGGDFPKIRYYLIEKRVNQKELAQKTRTSANTIYRLTHKANLTPSINYLIYLVLKHEYKLKLTEAEFNAMLK